MTHTDLITQWRVYAARLEHERDETDDVLLRLELKVRARELRNCARTLELVDSRLNETSAEVTQLEVKKTGGVG